MTFDNQSYDGSDVDSLFNQIISDDGHKKKLKKAVKKGNYDKIEEFIWKALSKLLCKSIPVLKNKPWLKWIVEQLLPIIGEFLWDWFFPYSNGY